MDYFPGQHTFLRAELKQVVLFRLKKLSSLSMHHFRRAAVLLSIPFIIVLQVVIHIYLNVWVSDPHPTHTVLCAAFDGVFNLFYYLPPLRKSERTRFPVLPYKVDEAIAKGIQFWRCRCVVDDRLQRFGVHLHAVPVALGKGWHCALLLLWCSGGPLLEMLADHACSRGQCMCSHRPKWTRPR